MATLLSKPALAVLGCGLLDEDEKHPSLAGETERAHALDGANTSAPRHEEIATSAKRAARLSQDPASRCRHVEAFRGKGVHAG